VTVVAIHIGQVGEPLSSVESIQALAGKGLEGDGISIRKGRSPETRSRWSMKRSSQMSASHPAGPVGSSRSAAFA
jgi:hypothetical protein